MPATPRRYWNFQETQGLQLEFRSRHALEFIAYYLDRIDQQLDRIATAAEANRTNLDVIAQIMPQMVSGVNR